MIQLSKQELLDFSAKSGANILSITQMADGRYYATKVNDTYRLLARQTNGSWSPVNSLEEVKKEQDVIVLTDCKDAKTGGKRTISVNDEYANWPLKTNFSFTVTSGRSRLEMQTISDGQLKELVED